MDDRSLRVVRFATLLVCVVLVSVVAATDPGEVVERAKAEAREIPKQAEALARLAWPADGPRDRDVQCLARQNLVEFGPHGLSALRQAVRNAPPLYQADAAAALVGANRKISAGIPPDLLPALEETIWYGSVEAKRIAIVEVSRYRYPPAVLSIMDAVVEHPELNKVAIRALGAMRDERARHFLGEILTTGSPRDRALAAAALARIGDRAVEVLREATRSTRVEVRRAALEALLPISGLEDLTVLHEYATLHPDDDAKLLSSVRLRAQYLEGLLEQAPELGIGPEPE